MAYSWTYEQKLKRDISKIITFIDNRIAFTEQPQLAHVLLETAQGMVTRTKGIDDHRDQRLDLQREINGMAILMHKVCK